MDRGNHCPAGNDEAGPGRGQQSAVSAAQPADGGCGSSVVKVAGCQLLVKEDDTLTIKPPLNGKTFEPPLLKRVQARWSQDTGFACKPDGPVKALLILSFVTAY